MEIDSTEPFEFLPESSSGLHLQVHPVRNVDAHIFIKMNLIEYLNIFIECCSLSQLVVLNVGDHFTRAVVNSEEAVPSASCDEIKCPVYKCDKNGVLRVIGCLLGEQKGRILDVRNSFDLVMQEGPDESVDFDVLHKKLEQCTISTVLGAKLLHIRSILGA